MSPTTLDRVRALIASERTVTKENLSRRLDVPEHEVQQALLVTRAIHHNPALSESTK